jgi:hypothetical protein
MRPRPLEISQYFLQRLACVPPPFELAAIVDGALDSPGRVDGRALRH